MRSCRCLGHGRSGRRYRRRRFSTRRAGTEKPYSGQARRGRQWPDLLDAKTPLLRGRAATTFFPRKSLQKPMIEAEKTMERAVHNHWRKRMVELQAAPNRLQKTKAPCQRRHAVTGRSHQPYNHFLSRQIPNPAYHILWVKNRTFTVSRRKK